MPYTKNNKKEKLTQQTIEDFGRQWSACQENEGYYGSIDHFTKLVDPVLDITRIQSATIAEIGVGTGRISQSLMALGADHLYAIEPSIAIEVAKENLKQWADKITFIHGRGDVVGDLQALDFVFSIGVIHHIYEPVSVLRAARNALCKGGSLVIWVYGKEGNAAYLLILNPIRRALQFLPTKCSWFVSWLLFPFAKLYGKVASIARIPLWKYFRSIYNKLSNRQQALVIHDQITPSVARYYSRENVEELFKKSGFHDVTICDVEGYSWVAIANK